MADNSILTPGYQDTVDVPTTVDESVQYLEKDNFLSEYENESEKSVVRENLNVYPKNAVYTKDETDTNIAATVTTAVNKHLSVEDPHGTLDTVREMITDMAKTDGSTPFTSPQSGVEPISDSHLTTKKFVTRLLNEHTRLVGSDDPHQILPEVRTILEKYVKSSDIFTKSQLYTKQDVDNLLKTFLKKDGSTPFTIAQIGVDPTIDSHLATKRYVDKTLYAHLVDVDPHGFLTILNQRLASYAKIANVYDKTQTYSRNQIDAFINKWVQEAVAEAIAEYMETVDDRFESIRQDRYVKQDGSVPFRNPQAGVDAIEPEHLVTLKQVEDKTSEIKEDLESKIQEKECVWITSGPVESTVGHVEDNTPMPATMTLQEVCDAIFYGKGICMEVPEYVVITKKCPITLCIHGSTGLVQVAQLFQNEKAIYTFTGDDFKDGCITVDSESLLEDAQFVFRVTYTNGSTHEETATVKCYMPVFVGLLPKWKTGSTITMDYLIQLCEEDTEGTQNRFINYGGDLKSFTFKYMFSDASLRHPFIVLPEAYPNLDAMVTKSQSFGIDAFDVINNIPLSVPGVEKDIIFKVYIYRQALATLNQEVTFNFESK